MTAQEIEIFFLKAKIGEEIASDMSATLWPDTEELESFLIRIGEDSFILKTFFREFWAGHGYSDVQVHEERKTAEEIKKGLEYYELILNENENIARIKSPYRS